VAAPLVAPVALAVARQRRRSTSAGSRTRRGCSSGGGAIRAEYAASVRSVHDRWHAQTAAGGRL